MNSPKTTRNHNVLALGFVSFFTDLASSMVVPVLPLFLVLVLDEEVEKVGLVLGIATLVSYALRFVGGALSDRLDANKPLLIAGYGLSAVSKPVFALSGGWQDVAALRSTERFGKALRAAPKDKLIGLSARQGSEGASFGLVKSLDVAGEFSGLVVLLGALAWLGATEDTFRAVFAASLVPGILAMLVLIVFVEDRRGGERKQQWFRLRLEPELRMTVGLFCGVSVFLFGEAFFLLKANELGIPLTISLALLIGARVVPLLVGVPVGKLLDRVPAARMLALGYVLGLAAMISLLLPGMVALAAAFGLFAVSELVMLTSIRSDISKRAADKGTAFGVFYLFYAISSALGALLIGFLWSAFGSATAVLASCAGLVIFATPQLVAGFNAGSDLRTPD